MAQFANSCHAVIVAEALRGDLGSIIQMTFLWPLLAFIIVSGFASTAFGQTYTIKTFAGGALPNNISGASAAITPSAVAVDASGNVYIGSAALFAVFRLDGLTGVLTLVAGNGTAASAVITARLPTPSCGSPGASPLTHPATSILQTSPIIASGRSPVG
jgi:hypothetical protein